MGSKKTLKLLAGAAATLVSCAASAAVSESFESGAFTTGWSGNGTFESETAPSVACGLPISGDHSKVLSVAGTVTCANSAAAGTKAQTDFLVYIPEAGEDLEPLSGVQVAIAAGSTATDDKVPLMLYCKGKTDGAAAASASWVEIGTVTIATWHRVTINFDYEASRCEVSIDGVPAVSDYGFLSASGTDNTTKGAWYALAAAPAEDANKKVSSLSFVGVAKIDDVVVREDVSDSIYTGNYPTAIGGETVSYSDLTKWGVTAETAATAKLDDSDLTVAQKLECGLNPTDGKTFEVSGVSFTSVTEATLTFPGSAKALSRYKVTGKDETDATVDVTVGTGSVENDIVSLPVTIGAAKGKVVYLTLTAEASAN